LRKRMTWADYKVLLNKTGWNATAVGKSLGVSSSVMSQRMTALGIDFRKEKAAHLEQVRLLRREMFKKEFVRSGYSVPVMAKRVGASPTALRFRTGLFGFKRSGSEESVSYAVKVDDSSIERLRDYLKTIKEDTGIEFTLHEAMRTAIYGFSRKPRKRVYTDCLAARGRSWRLGRKPRSDAKE